MTQLQVRRQHSDFARMLSTYGIPASQHGTTLYGSDWLTGEVRLWIQQWMDGEILDPDGGHVHAGIGIQFAGPPVDTTACAAALVQDALRFSKNLHLPAFAVRWIPSVSAAHDDVRNDPSELTRLTGVPLLVIPDLDSGMGYALDTVTKVVSLRYARGYPTITTGTPNQLGSLPIGLSSALSRSTRKVPVS